MDAPPADSLKQTATNWTTNTRIEEIAASLVSARDVVVLTHAKPDGDATGSSLAVVRALQHLNVMAAAHYFGPIPAWLKEIAGTTPHHVYENTTLPTTLPADAVVIVDTGSWTQLEPMKDWLSTRTSMASLLDHHVQGNPDVAARRFIETTAAAACQPAARLCMALLQVPTADKLPSDVAEALYLGLATDTGWFRHSNVTRSVMELAGQLLDAGADHVRLYQTMEQNETQGRLRLISRALNSLDLRLDNRLALMTLTQEDLRESGALPGETGGLTDFTQGIASVQVSGVLLEVPGDKPGTRIVKISLRSKPGPVDVNAIAGTLGGGGHVRAAGAKVKMTLDEAKDTVTRLVSEQLR
ncbi:MAG TPA: bifunctional oligoribonuclease/PAP phosphatase NrnA [Phycisphaerales bacterium]|nr:bifunctional oligoribonuclease/PAP phosphatase NrnA [Phycisphaerales bacterium]